MVEFQIQLFPCLLLCDALLHGSAIIEVHLPRHDHRTVQADGVIHLDVWRDLADRDVVTKNIAHHSREDGFEILLEFVHGESVASRFFQVHLSIAFDGGDESHILCHKIKRTRLPRQRGRGGRCHHASRWSGSWWRGRRNGRGLPAFGRYRHGPLRLLGSIGADSCNPLLVADRTVVVRVHLLEHRLCLSLIVGLNKESGAVRKLALWQNTI
mmetsp:Transcript_43221/g.113720  ORF Transcript_43221/g.113720 Transcript_43221/m.113720 type:complete len:212 (+) Transcript_43221:673-1308(+)